MLLIKSYNYFINLEELNSKASNVIDNLYKKMDGERMEKNTRKALKDAYKNRLRIGGIYRISCNNNSSNWVRASTDLQGIKNRFLFSVSSNTCPDKSMFPEWNQYGASAFSFEILEEIQQTETQTEQEFSEEVNTLLELWNEKKED